MTEQNHKTSLFSLKGDSWKHFITLTLTMLMSQNLQSGDGGGNMSPSNILAIKTHILESI